MSYKYHTPAEYDQMIRETEAEMDRREQEARLNEGIARLQAYMDAHPDEVARDPMVQALRRMQPQGATPASVAQPTAPAPAAPQRATTTPAKPATLPAVINGNARFDPSHLKMKPATPQIDSVKDSYVHSPGSTIRQR